MSERFEDRVRAGLRAEAAWLRGPGDPVADVRRRMRRQDVVFRAGSGAAALAAVVLAVVIGLPALAGGQIVFDEQAADGGSEQAPDSPAPDEDPDPSGDDAASDPAEPDEAPDPPGEDVRPDPAAPGDDGGPACSAAGLAGEPALEPELPSAVERTRERIVEAAIACDYAALAVIAAESDQFTHSFGGGGDPAAYWRRAESDGEPVMRLLAELLDRPHATVDGADPALFAWPSAFAYEHWTDVPTEDREALRPLYGDADFDDFAAFGSYIGYRVGISSDGQWRYFVAGD